MTMTAFLNTYRVTMTADLTDHNPDAHDDKWAATATHWRCRIRCGRRSMVVYFSQGPAIAREPSAADVLDCLASDAAGFENAGDFAEWCGEYGYDTDSRRAEKTYRAIEKQAERLARLLPVDAYDTLLWHTERIIRRCERSTGSNQLGSIRKTPSGQLYDAGPSERGDLTMNGHTPGPWYVCAGMIASDVNGGRSLLATCPVPATAYERECWTANARLIAEAPAMLALLREGLAMLEHMTSAQYSRGEDKRWREQVADLLARVEGRP